MDWFVLMERRTKQQQLRGKLKWNPIKQMEMKFVWWMELKGAATHKASFKINFLFSFIKNKVNFNLLCVDGIKKYYNSK